MPGSLQLYPFLCGTLAKADIPQQRTPTHLSQPLHCHYVSTKWQQDTKMFITATISICCFKDYIPPLYKPTCCSIDVKCVLASNKKVLSGKDTYACSRASPGPHGVS